MGVLKVKNNGAFVDVGGASLPAFALGGWDGTTGEWIGRLTNATWWYTSGGAAAHMQAASLELQGWTPTLPMEVGVAGDKSFAMYYTGAGPYLFIRWIDENNWVGWAPIFSGTEGRFRVKTAGTIVTEAATSLYAGGAASSYGISVVGNLISLYRDGVLVTTRTVTEHASATKIAVGHSNTTGSMYVTKLKFGATSIP